MMAVPCLVLWLAGIKGVFFVWVVGTVFVGFALGQTVFRLGGPDALPIELDLADDGTITLPDEEKSWHRTEVCTHLAWTIAPWQVVVVVEKASGREMARLIFYDKAERVAAVERILADAPG